MNKIEEFVRDGRQKLAEEYERKGLIVYEIKKDSSYGFQSRKS